MSDNQTEIGIGLLGYGETGRRHARAWRAMGFDEGTPRVRLVAVVDPDTDAADRAVEEAGFEFIAPNVEELIAHPAIHIVDICTPATEHAEALRSAMAAGKHISVAAPLAFGLREAEEISGLGGRTPGVKFVATTWRNLPALALARELIEADFLGEPRRFSLRHLESVRPDGACAALLPSEDMPTTCLLPQALDLARALAGEMSEVSASFTHFPAEADESDADAATATALMRFVSGATGILQSSAVSNGLPETLDVEFAGSDGAIRFDLATPDTLHIFDATADPSLRGWKSLKTPAACDGDVAALTAFSRAVAEDAPVRPNFRDGLMVHRIADAMRQSANSGGWEPVDLGR